MQVIDDLRSLEHDAEQAGVRLETRLDDDGIMLEVLVRQNAPRGAGASHLRRLCAIADRHRLAVTLIVDGNIARLLAYYEAFGFADLGGLGLMRRAPRDNLNR